jgi:transcriptional regulator with PAS, ATPase and Fis domain
MDKKVEVTASVDLISLVNSHDKPFVVIDKDFCILAVNKAYEQEYGETRENAVGRKCYQVSHGKDHPCSVDGEDCPYEHVYSKAEVKTCMHIHCDANHHMHQVKVSAFPLKGINGEMFMGECIEEIPSENNYISGAGCMVGESDEFRAFMTQLDIAAGSDAPVLLQGETGTGKELAAEYIHTQSARKLKPFQIVDSTVLTENLFESDMFGHVDGAFTGSVGNKQGLFELAEGGTLFLDEIGDMPVSQQAKLLRVLESGQFRRVGGKNIHQADVRIICATNRSLWESVMAGTFREDLYYRIACLNVRLPALRERIDDVPVLARSLLDGINHSMRRSYHLTPDVYERLKAYQYPGNVRELRNILFIAATHSDKREIDGALIDSVMKNLPNCDGQHVHKSRTLNHHAPMPMPAVDTEEHGDIPVTLKDIEAKHIRELLAMHHGNRKKVATTLGISERTIYRKIKDFGIN